jgi:type II secretory pathway pseudopilin PulG
MMRPHLIEENIIDRLFGWWYAIATPRERSKDAPLHERALIRKSRFISLVLLIEIVYHVFYLYVVVVLVNAPDAALPISITIGCFIIGIILNRLGKQRIAGIIAFAAIELSMCLYFINECFGAGGFSPSDLAVLSILVSPDIIAIALFPTWIALSLGTFNCLFVIVILAFLPKTPDMIQQLAILGPIDYYQQVSIQAVVILVSLLWANSALYEMKRADRAEEINKLTQALTAHQQAAFQEKQQLEASIQQIVAIHTRVANGELGVRVPLDQKNKLWLIAGPLNNLLARAERWRQGAQQQQQTELAIQQALHDIQQAKKQGAPLRIRKTGTSIDPILAEITGDRFSHPSSSHGSPPMTPSPMTPPPLPLDKALFPEQNT